MKRLIKIEFECLCNLNCDYCYCKGKKFESPVEEVCRKIDNIFKDNNPEDTFFRVEGIGEITLYPQIVNYLIKKVNEGYLIEVLSNGILTEFIKENINLKWVISIDGHTIWMNKLRNLSENQISKILDIIINYNLEIQCVFSNQTVDEINEFISYLESRNYKGFLHIFPQKYTDRQLDRYLDCDQLIKTDFIPTEDYFKRWKYIYENKKRNFTCDFFKVGYVYRIMHDEEEIRKIKCDCGSYMFEYEQNTKYNDINCNMCINHFEYVSKRKLVFGTTPGWESGKIINGLN